MTAYCGDFPNDDVDDCEFPDSTNLCVGHVVHCERCGRVWKLVEMFDSKMWESVTLVDGNGNRIEP